VKASNSLGDNSDSLFAVPTPPDTRLQFATRTSLTGGGRMINLLWNVLREDEAQDIAEYAVMLAVILVIVVGTIRLIGSNANTVFSSTASAIQ
jgi:Flp pilus assembly pilin Flp